MTPTEKMYFQSLTTHRSGLAKALEDPALRGVRYSVVEKYSDQAHFIYELLQNADDAHATNARFVLEKDKLIFAHDGTRHFSISDPAREDADSANKSLGDINAITSIANSSKTGASIGKFGVGFKAVFQYTATPHIYDPEFCFKIERFIVPIMLDGDFPGRAVNETLFVFPFDHPERNAVSAYEDISDKLRNLVYPLLFMSNLKHIEYCIADSRGMYEKSIKNARVIDKTKAEFISLVHNNGIDLIDEDLWLFSRSYDRGNQFATDERYMTYATGFFLDVFGHLKPVDKPAFCFFPTKETTNLKFIVHAPFLLTDSREGIRAGVTHNDEMIRSLSGLAADALEYLRDIGMEQSSRLIDDGIVNIIPVNREAFSDPSDKSRISFLPFYNQIKIKMRSARIMPSTAGYIWSGNAYWASSPQLTQMFSNEQLGEIVDNSTAAWVFPSLSREDVQRYKKDLFTYLDDLVRTSLSEDVIICGRAKESYFRDGKRYNLESIKGITAEFIEKQPHDWLHRFYKWLSDTKHRTEMVADKPIFIDQDGKATPAFDKQGQMILFLPVKDVAGYRVVHPDLLENEETKRFILQIGIKQPSLRDQIYNIILPKYRDGEDIDTTPHFMMFFKYFCSSPYNEAEDFVNLIKEYKFLTCYEKGFDHPYRAEAASMYMPTADLIEYFQTKNDTCFLALEGYRKLAGPSLEKQLMDFLTKLGVKSCVSVIRKEIDPSSSDREDLPTPRSTRGITYTEAEIDGCKEILEYIVAHKDAKKSVVLWNCLLRIIDTQCTAWNCNDLDSLLIGSCDYFFRTPRKETFDSADAIRIKQMPWLADRGGKLVAASDLTMETLADFYETESETAQRLLAFLRIANDDEEGERDSNLTDEQREKIAFADKLKEFGIFDEEDLKEFREFRRQRIAKQLATPDQIRDGAHEGEQQELKLPRQNIVGDDIGDVDFDFDGSDDAGKPASKGGNRVKKETADVLRNIARRTAEKPTASIDPALSEEPEVDGDEFTPPTVDYGKKIERAMEKSAAEIEKIAQFEELQKLAVESEKYSYGWFKALLDMECINSGESNSQSREISISFTAVEREPGTNRTLVLKHPSRYIPQFMEDLADIPLVLHMGDQTKTLAIEVASIKSYTLRVKLKSSVDIEGLDLGAVTSATIDAKSPVFLLEELKKRFAELNLKDDYSMQRNLCENIEFVFGPPGTGKTTYLANRVLIPLMRENKKAKVLVLTPTNKAADVLVRRIMEVSGEDHSYENWLVRFGATADEEIEQNTVYREKTFDIRPLEQNVTVTTIARFPYDFFMPQSERLYLHAINWDYIVIDEASMIPIVNIVYPLYRKTPKKFIIAGDPFQIEPITTINLWKNENIYTMVHLDSFVEPTTFPYQYKVTLLTTQYRSIPDVGYVFSNFAYGGILKHHRRQEEQRSLGLPDSMGVKTLNIIKFPVRKYESIYRCKRLQHSSSYQVYSALFTFEYVCFFSKKITATNPGQLFKIGVIAPYRAQADMIDKLLASEEHPAGVDIQVGTIHGFQGDECDIIFAVFNPPPTISASKDMFLNKMNIINVSISRARDYLFVVMPDDLTENITNLRLVRRVEDLIHDTGSWAKFASPDLEYMMFGDLHYLENNAFSTSHQSVNVYGLPEKCYEIRTEDTAVDVQIHKAALQNGGNVPESTPASVQLKEMPEVIPEPVMVIEEAESGIPETAPKEDDVDYGWMPISEPPVPESEAEQVELSDAIQMPEDVGEREMVEDTPSEDIRSDSSRDRLHYIIEPIFADSRYSLRFPTEGRFSDRIIDIVEDDTGICIFQLWCHARNGRVDFVTLENRIRSIPFKLRLAAESRETVDTRTIYGQKATTYKYITEKSIVQICKYIATHEFG